MTMRGRQDQGFDRNYDRRDDETRETRGQEFGRYDEPSSDRGRWADDRQAREWSQSASQRNESEGQWRGGSFGRDANEDWRSSAFHRDTNRDMGSYGRDMSSRDRGWDRDNRGSYGSGMGGSHGGVGGGYGQSFNQGQLGQGQYGGSYGQSQFGGGYGQSHNQGQPGGSNPYGVGGGFGQDDARFSNQGYGGNLGSGAGGLGGGYGSSYDRGLGYGNVGRPNQSFSGGQSAGYPSGGRYDDYGSYGGGRGGFGRGQGMSDRWYSNDRGWGGGNFDRDQLGYGGYDRDDDRGQTVGGMLRNFGENVKRVFTGKGPKGYKRSDDRIREDICDRLSMGDIDASDVEVQVRDGEVTLAGTVRDRRHKHRIEDLSESIPGVQDVTNNIRVKRDTDQTVGFGGQSTGASSGSTTGTTGTSHTGMSGTNGSRAVTGQSNDKTRSQS